jgi:hypothetical protein
MSLSKRMSVAARATFDGRARPPAIIVDDHVLACRGGACFFRVYRARPSTLKVDLTKSNESRISEGSHRGGLRGSRQSGGWA